MDSELWGEQPPLSTDQAEAGYTPWEEGGAGSDWVRYRAGNEPEVGRAFRVTAESYDEDGRRTILEWEYLPDLPEPWAMRQP